MEEQIVKQIRQPRITLKKGTMKKGEIGWEITSYSSEDKEELGKIIVNLKEAHEEMIKQFGGVTK